MLNSSQSKFDFDYWAELATSDPEGFETQRDEMISAAIDKASERVQPRLRSLQWRLDQVRRTSKTPLTAAARMNKMMWERVVGPGGLLETLDRIYTLDTCPVHEAKILQFDSDHRQATL